MGRPMTNTVVRELRIHAPYTLLGACGGVALMVVLAVSGVPRSCSETLFWMLHPLHVLLSALVTVGILRLHRRAGWTMTVVVGYLGSVGIATLSDCVIPFVGESLLNLPHRAIHFGFVEKWWLVNPLAATGIVLAVWRPWTKFSHAGHVWLSTWASLFHMTMAMNRELSWSNLLRVPLFLFLAVWIPCCTSDILFPLLFARDPRRPGAPQAEATPLQQIQLEERERRVDLVGAARGTSE